MGLKFHLINQHQKQEVEAEGNTKEKTPEDSTLPGLEEQLEEEAEVHPRLGELSEQGSGECTPHPGAGSKASDRSDVILDLAGSKEILDKGSATIEEEERANCDVEAAVPEQESLEKVSNQASQLTSDDSGKVFGEGKMSFSNDKSKQYIPGIHKEWRPFVCDICGRGFYENCLLKSHVSTIHENVWPYRCDVCNKGFSNRSARTIHRSRIHEPVECGLCGEKFPEKSHLMKHKSKVHKSFKCDLCEKFFAKKSYLKRHVAKTHENV